MHFIIGCKVSRQHRLLSPTTSHYSALCRQLQRLLAQKIPELYQNLKLMKRNDITLLYEMGSSLARDIPARIHKGFIETQKVLLPDKCSNTEWFHVL